MTLSFSYLLREEYMPFYERKVYFYTFFNFWCTSYLYFNKGGLEMKAESKFQSELIKKLKIIFKGCIVYKNDANYIQGFPDIIILYKKHWACLECKKFADASKRPNQEFYVNMLNKMSFSRFIYPENEEEVLDELQRAFKLRR
jgi:hypothetical protein